MTRDYNLLSVKKVKVFQIGLGSFGRHGFEKFIEMDLNYSKVSVELVGVCDDDFDRLELAEKFANRQNIEIETYTSVDEIYNAAESISDAKVLIYDAGPTELHAEHIYRSLKNNFFHLAEKPPSMTREDHIREKKMMLDNNVRFTVDFIERENPVVKKCLEVLEDCNIENIEVFRESSMGIEKLLRPVNRAGVKGGAVLDKMCHEAYIMDFIDSKPEVNYVEKQAQMPYRPGSESLMGIRGGKKSEIDDEIAAGICSAKIDADIDIYLHASWLGLSQECRNSAEKIESITGHYPVKTDFRVIGASGVSDEEARFFLIRGDRDLIGDMLHKKLFDLETGEEIETNSLLHDQLYRVLESSVRCAAGLENNALSEEDLDRFMNVIFDISEHTEDYDVYEEVETANKRVKRMILDTLDEVETTV